MKTNLISLSLKATCIFALLGAVACTSSTGEEPTAKTKSASTSTKGANGEEPGDKIYCQAHADCDSDETCVDGRCTGLDGDTE